MEAVGKVVEWNDARGFGFILPIAGTQHRLFFHIRDYARPGRRPEIGELVKYTPSRGKDGKECAVAIRRARHGTRKSTRQHHPSNTSVLSGPLQFALLAMYTGALAWSVHSGHVPLWFAYAISTASVVTFLLYLVDKQASRARRRRVPEANLHLLELIGGWPGALLGQLLLRHKSSKRDYQWVFWCIVATNVVATLVLATA